MRERQPTIFCEREAKDKRQDHSVVQVLFSADRKTDGVELGAAGGVRPLKRRMDGRLEDLPGEKAALLPVRRQPGPIEGEHVLGRKMLDFVD